MFLRGFDYLWRFFFLSFSFSFIQFVFFRIFLIPIFISYSFPSSSALITCLHFLRTLIPIIHITLYCSSARPASHHKWHKTTLWYWQWFIEPYGFTTIANSSVIGIHKFYGLELSLLMCLPGEKL